MRKMESKVLVAIIGGICSVLAFAAACSVNEMKSYLCRGEVLTKAEIMELADAKLKRFCLSEGIDKKEFSDPPKLSLEERQKLWVIDYENSEHFVRFTVDNCGWIETSSGPSGKVTKIE